MRLGSLASAEESNRQELESLRAQVAQLEADKQRAAKSEENWQKVNQALVEKLEETTLDRERTRMECEALKRADELKSKEVENLQSSLQLRGIEVDQLNAAIAGRDVEIKVQEEAILRLQEGGTLAEQKIQDLTAEVELLSSEAYKEKYIEEFRGSGVYAREVNDQAYQYLERGAAHMARQVWPHVADKKVLARAYIDYYGEKQCRAGAKYVPFTADEVTELQDMDAAEGDQPWDPPTPEVPNFWDLVEDCKNELPVPPAPDATSSTPHE